MQGYSYSVFDLVYETNVASSRLLEGLDFERLGMIPGCGRMGNQLEPVSAIIYGKSLKFEADNPASEERFDRIRYYLKHGLYPPGADKMTKCRLRSAAMHYRLVEGRKGQPDMLMLKDKEVVSDPFRQAEIAQEIHRQSHAGINKTTAIITAKYHWTRIKETATSVVRNCPECSVGEQISLKRSDSNHHSDAPSEVATPFSDRSLASSDQTNVGSYFPASTEQEMSSDQLERIFTALVLKYDQNPQMYSHVMNSF